MKAFLHVRNKLERAKDEFQGWSYSEELAIGAELVVLGLETSLNNSGAAGTVGHFDTIVKVIRRRGDRRSIDKHRRGEMRKGRSHEEQSGDEGHQPGTRIGNHGGRRACRQDDRARMTCRSAICLLPGILHAEYSRGRHNSRGQG